MDNSAAPANAQINVVGARNSFGAGGEDAITETGGYVFLPQAVETFTYDDDGNLTSDGRWNYTWDGENRLVSMEATANVPPEAKQRLEFSYDYMARRIQKKVYAWNVQTSSYQLQLVRRFVCDEWNVIAELDGNNALVRSYVWGQDVSGSLQGAGGISGLLSMSEGGQTYQAGYDANGNLTTLVKASTGTTSALYEFDPFGNTTRATGEYAATNPFKFSTKFTDAETSLVYYGLRYYQPQTGGWLSRDPIEEAGGINLYGFVGNDPVNNIDPFGLYEEDGLALAGIKEKRGYIDRSGRMVIEWREGQSDGLRFSEGLATIRIGEKEGFIDKTGEIVIKPEYDSATFFSDGMALVMVGDKFGYIDHSGNLVIKPQYSLAFHFSEGLADVKIGDQWSYIDKTGQIAIKPQFDQAYEFQHGLARVKTKNGTGYIDRTGRYIWPPTR